MGLVSTIAEARVQPILELRVERRASAHHLSLRNCQAVVSPKSHTLRSIDWGAAIFRDKDADF